MPRRSSPITSNSLTEPSLPSRDWAAFYGEIEDYDEAQKYHKLFSVSFYIFFICYRMSQKTVILRFCENFSKIIYKGYFHARNHFEHRKTLKTHPRLVLQKK